MTITQATRSRVIEAIPAVGAPLRVIAATSGVHISNVRTVVKLLAEEHQVFILRTGTGQGGKHELWAFVDQAVRDYYAGHRAREADQRQRQREQDKAAARKAEREQQESRNARSIAAQRREAERARQRAEALEKAEAEKLARKATQAKLRVMTAAAGATVFKAGTLTPKAKRKAELPVHIPDGLCVTRLESNFRERFTPAPDEVAPCFSSLRPGQYLDATPKAWVEAAAA